MGYEITIRREMELEMTFYERVLKLLDEIDDDTGILEARLTRDELNFLRKLLQTRNRYIRQNAAFMCTLQTVGPVPDGTQLVIYEHPDGKLRARPQEPYERGGPVPREFA